MSEWREKMIKDDIYTLREEGRGGGGGGEVLWEKEVRECLDMIVGRELVERRGE